MIERRQVPEVVITLISVLVVSSLIVYALGQEQQRRDSAPSNVTMVFDPASATYHDGLYFVPYTVNNGSSHAIDSADMVIEVLDGDDIVESSEISLVSLPLDGRQNGIYASRFDPGSHTLRGRLTSLVFP